VPSIESQRLPLNLLAAPSSEATRVALNLGVDAGQGGPDPSVVVGGAVLGTSVRWGARSLIGIGTALAWGGFERLAPYWRQPWGGLASTAPAWQVAWGAPAVTGVAGAVRWGHGSADVHRPFWGLWASLRWEAASVGLLWRYGNADVLKSLASPWASPPRVELGLRVAWRVTAPNRHLDLRGLWERPLLRVRPWRIPWGTGRGLEWVIRPPVVRPEPPIPSLVDGRYVGLDLGCPVFTGDARRIPLNLGISACYMVRPQRRTYVVLNEIQVVRLPDRLPIEVDAIGIGGSREAWCWDLRLTLLKPEQLAALQPNGDGPRQVEVTINGYRWIFAVESFNQGRVFGQTSVDLAGRSVSAQLAQPYAALRSRAVDEVRTMAQLAELEVDGSPISVEYDTVDWLVTAGAWYYESLAPMSALMRLAEAAGGVVQSHPSEPSVRLLPKYPISPWKWSTSTPEVTIQDDIVTGQRLQLQSRPLFDAVIVAGERVGVAAKVKRDGEAGQTYAPQQIDQLMTHADGCRERGRNVLSDRGGQAIVEHDLPLFAAPLQAGQPGLVLPMALVRREAADGTWHGQAVGVRIEARRDGSAIEVTQTVTIERHYTDAD